MIRGTTPILTFKINTELDLSEIDKAEITFKSMAGSKEKTWDQNRMMIDTQEKIITLSLTQQETLYFDTGEINIQLRIKMNDELVYASKIITNSLDKILKEGVI